MSKYVFYVGQNPVTKGKNKNFPELTEENAINEYWGDTKPGIASEGNALVVFNDEVTAIKVAKHGVKKSDAHVVFKLIVQDAAVLTPTRFVEGRLIINKKANQAFEVSPENVQVVSASLQHKNPGSENVDFAYASPALLSAGAASDQHEDTELGHHHHFLSLSDQQLAVLKQTLSIQPTAFGSSSSSSTVPYAPIASKKSGWRNFLLGGGVATVVLGVGTAISRAASIGNRQLDYVLPPIPTPVKVVLFALTVAVAGLVTRRECEKKEAAWLKDNQNPQPITHTHHNNATFLPKFTSQSPSNTKNPVSGNVPVAELTVTKPTAQITTRKGQ
jgi:hypothetical protein